MLTFPSSLYQIKIGYVVIRIRRETIPVADFTLNNIIVELMRQFLTRGYFRVQTDICYLIFFCLPLCLGLIISV